MREGILSMIPNLLSEVAQAKHDFPQEWRDAHTSNSRTEAFIKLLAARLHAVDPRFGLNGKRGVATDLSDDAINFLCEASESTGRTPEGLPCVVIDVIASAGTDNASPAWQVFTKAPEANGAWVKPGAASAPGQPPKPVEPPHVCPPPPVFTPPSRAEMMDEGAKLHQFYIDGLRREHGLWIAGHPDWEGIGAWLFDVYLNARVAGKSREDSRALYQDAIKASAEWKAKNR